MPSPTPSRPRVAFTLIELLVAITVIVLLITLLLPGLAASRAHARDLVCKVKLRKLAPPLYFYQEDFKGVYPPRFDFGGSVLRTWSGYFLSPYMPVKTSSATDSWAKGFNTDRCPEDAETSPKWCGYNVTWFGGGAARNGQTPPTIPYWQGEQLYQRNGAIRVAKVNPDGSLNRDLGLFDSPALRNVRAENIYIAEGALNDSEGVEAGFVFPSQLRFRHGGRHAVTRFNQMNYLSADLAVRTFNAANVSSATLTTRLYSDGSLMWMRVTNSDSGNVNDWPYPEIKQVAQGLAGN